MRTKASPLDYVPHQSAPNVLGAQDSTTSSAIIYESYRSPSIQRNFIEIANRGPRLEQQRKAVTALQRKADEDALALNRTGLPDQLKAGLESLSGISMDGVKVHYNSAQPAQLDAHAYAQGTDIHIAPGQEQYLPHEAWHVVQQAQGRVQPTMQMQAGVSINDDEGLENEATVMGAQALAAGADVSQRAAKSSKEMTVSNDMATRQNEAFLLQRAAVIQRNFVGNEARFHVHRVGGNEHFKYGNEQATRQNFVHGGHLNQANLQAAIAQCHASRALHPGAADTASFNTVLAYLTGLVVAAPPPPAAPPPVAPAAPPAASVVVAPQADFDPDVDFM